MLQRDRQPQNMNQAGNSIPVPRGFLNTSNPTVNNQLNQLNNQINMNNVLNQQRGIPPNQGRMAPGVLSTSSNTTPTLNNPMAYSQLPVVGGGGQTLNQNNLNNFLRTSNGNINAMNLTNLNNITAGGGGIGGSSGSLPHQNFNLPNLPNLNLTNLPSNITSSLTSNLPSLPTGINLANITSLTSSAPSLQPVIGLNSSNPNFPPSSLNSSLGQFGMYANVGNIPPVLSSSPPPSSSSSSMGGVLLGGMQLDRSTSPIGNDIMSSLPIPSSSSPAVNFDMINDFPALGSSTSSSSSSSSKVEYKIQSKEDFPALGSSKPPSSSSSSQSSSSSSSSTSNPLPIAAPQSSSSSSIIGGDHHLPSTLNQDARSSSSSSGDNTGKIRGENKYDLMGLLNVIRMTDQNLNTLALGTDLTTLGLNLNSSGPLYVNFMSPFAEVKKEPMDYTVPSCYKLPTPMQQITSKIGMFSEDTLFYIYYSMPKDSYQLFAASELYRREWRYHTELQRWIQRINATSTTGDSKTSNTSPPSTSTSTSNSFYVFEPKIWEKIRKDNFVINFEMLEDEKTINNYLQSLNSSTTSSTPVNSNNNPNNNAAPVVNNSKNGNPSIAVAQ